MAEKIRKYKYVILTFLILLVVLIITSIIKSVYNSQYQNAANILSDVNNKIASLSIEETKVEYVMKPFLEKCPDGLDVERWKKDTEDFLAWIKPAFTYSNSDEYNANREIFIERLGSTNYFLTDVMRPYVAKYSEMRSEYDIINDGTKISSSIQSFKTYVVNISEDDTYTYAAVLSNRYFASGARDGQPHIYAITYDIDISGNISNVCIVEDENRIMQIK